MIFYLQNSILSVIADFIINMISFSDSYNSDMANLQTTEHKVDAVSLSTIDHTVFDIVSTTSNASKFKVGFSTASNKVLTVYGESMKQAANLLSESKPGRLFDTNTVCNLSDKNEPSIKLSSFQPFEPPKVAWTCVSNDENIVEQDISTPLTASQLQIMENDQFTQDIDDCSKEITYDADGKGQNQTISVPKEMGIVLGKQPEKDRFIINIK